MQKERKPVKSLSGYHLLNDLFRVYLDSRPDVHGDPEKLSTALTLFTIVHKQQIIAALTSE